ncbi:MAG TPA: tetratricopeptide repeat protein [Acidimicrobiales bacterium]|jgi:hypothetical protein
MAAAALPILVALVLAAYQLSLPSVLFGVHSSATLGTEYDDGVYLGAAIRFVHGVLPYRDFDFVQPPGIVWLMSPIALLGRLLGSRDAMAMARCLTAVIEGLNAGLVAILVRKYGSKAMLTAGLAFATFPLAVAADHSLTLEPYLTCFVLVAAILIFGRIAPPSFRGVMVAGISLGFAGTVKLWAVLPLLAVLVCLLPRWKVAIRPLLTGCLIGFGIPSLPFLIAAPSAFVKDVIVSQLSRGADPVRGSLTVAQRLVMMTGLGGLSRYAADTGLAVVIILVLVGLAALTYSLELRRLSSLDHFALLAVAIVIPAMFLAPEFYDYYSYFPHVFLCVLLGVCIGQLASIASRLRLTSNRVRHALLQGAFFGPSVLVIALFLVLIAPDVSYARTFLNGSVDPSAALDAAIPNGACLTFDQPGSAINANRFTPSGSGCPAIVDPFGMWIVRNNGNLPGTTQPYAAAFVADWQSWLSRSDFVLLAVPLSDYIPWTPSLIQWFDQRFTLIYSSPRTYLYRNTEAEAPTTNTPSTASELIAAGLTAEAAGHDTQALADYEAAAAKNRDDLYAPYDIGYLDQVMGKSSKAADEYRIALRVNPTFFDALYNLGVLEASLDPKSAIRYYTAAVKVVPDNAAANFNLGVLLIRQGDVTRGDSYVETGIRLEPSLADDLPKGISVPSTTTPAS